MSKIPPSVLPAAILALLIAAPAPASAGPLEDAVLAEMNLARTQPRQYARLLQRHAVAYRQDGPYSSFAHEDPAAFQEAIDFLMRQQPLPPLKRDARLAAAARDHAAAQGSRGGVGHRSPNGDMLGQRLQRHGLFAGVSAENISYGYSDAREVVRQLIVDSGVPNRGHRKNIFGRSFQAAGVACGGHRNYGSMCVIDFAGAIVAR